MQIEVESQILDRVKKSSTNAEGIKEREDQLAKL